MLRKLLSCTAVVLLGAAAPALAQELSDGPYTRSPAHENAVQRGAPFVDALNTLEAQGYASYSNFQQQGDKFTADAVKDGQTMHVIIDPITHQVTNAGPAQNGPETMTGGAR